MIALRPVREGALAAMSATSVGALGTQVLRERFEAGEGRFLAEDFHRLEQGRRDPAPGDRGSQRDRKSTRLNSSHVANSYAVFCLKKKRLMYSHSGINHLSGSL